MLNKVADVITKATGRETEVSSIFKDDCERECVFVGNQNGVRAVLYKDNVESIIDKFGFYDGCREIVKMLNERNIDDIDGIVDTITDWETARPHLINCLRRPTGNSGHVTRKFLDLEQYCRLDFDNASICVTEGLLLKWEITEDELFEAACDNQKFSICGLKETLTGVKSQEDDDILFVIGTDREYGAGIMCDPGTMKIIREYINSDFYVIPSSIHELLVAKKDLTCDTSMFKDLIKHVNDTEVVEDEILSYSLYEYTKDNGLAIVE